jgi:hypothetical protein
VSEWNALRRLADVRPDQLGDGLTVVGLPLLPDGQLERVDLIESSIKRMVTEPGRQAHTTPSTIAR